MGTRGNAYQKRDVETAALSTNYLPHAGAAGPAATLTDDKLMLQVRAGHIGLLAELFERHHKQVYGFLYRMSSNRELCEDLVQDVFLRILKYRDSYRPDQSFTAWMYGIARNAFIDCMRKRRPETPWEDAAPELKSPDNPADERIRREQETELLQRALASLPIEKREVLILSRYQDLSYEEIGRILGCEPNAVKQRVFRAVKALGERFDQLSKRRAAQ